MNEIAELLDRDLSKPIEDVVSVNRHDAVTVFAELTEYIATDRIRAEYERLFSMMAIATKSPDESAGIWISGFLGSGRTSFAKNLGYVLANRDVNGVSASSLFLKQLGSGRIAECVAYLNRAVPYEVFMIEVQEDPPMQTNEEHIVEVMYRALLRGLDYAEDHEIAELEIELERTGNLVAFHDLCRAEYGEEWPTIRSGNPRLAQASALLYQLDPSTYSTTGAWLTAVKTRPSKTVDVKQLVERSFDLCEMRRHGSAIAFVLDDIGQSTRLYAERLEILRAIVKQFGKESLQRWRAGKIPGPAWIICTAQEKLLKSETHFKCQIDLSAAGIGEIVTRRVLRKKTSQEPILRKLFQDQGLSLIQHVKLEQCSRCTEFNEHQFVQCYPYLPHLIGLSVEIMAGICLHPYSLKGCGDSNRTIVKQSLAMLVSNLTGLARQPVGVLVSIDKIYELVEANIPLKKQKDIHDICLRFYDDKAFPGMAGRVVKAICLMEFVQADLPRTTRNIAALLVQRVSEAPPTTVTAAALYRLREAGLVRETEDGWKLCDHDELRRATASLVRLGSAVGLINPRPPGRHNELIQFAKKLVLRLLAWYTRPLREFNASVRLSLEEIVCALDCLSMNMADQFAGNRGTLDHLSMNSVALEARLAHLEKTNATLTEFIEEQLEVIRQQVKAAAQKAEDAEPEARVETIGDRRAGDDSGLYIDMAGGNDRTAYVIGLFGTGRRYINELIVRNIGQRAKYFRESIRLHPGPTPMIYSGHATIRHISRAQEPPVVMSRILESVKSGYANVVFVYRHPLDSLLTNWVWWRTYIRNHRAISGISEVYNSADALSADLERNFSEFEAFAEGDPGFFAAMPGGPFLSFAEFVEETVLHLQSATLSLRLEDFMDDPSREFSKIIEVMLVNLDLSRLSVPPPRAKPYGYLAAKREVPQFRSFIDGLDPLTKRRIENIGYDLGA